jgi:hypothetical protein
MHAPDGGASGGDGDGDARYNHDADHHPRDAAATTTASPAATRAVGNDGEISTARPRGTSQAAGGSSRGGLRRVRVPVYVMLPLDTVNSKPSTQTANPPPWTLNPLNPGPSSNNNPWVLSSQAWPLTSRY